MKDNLVWQVLADEYSNRQAAEDFAKKYFDVPRQVEYFRDETNNLYAAFKLVNGNSEYIIKFRPGVALVSSTLRQIYRRDNAW